MQPYRFEKKPGSPFSGTLIDRSKPISFTINGREFPAFEGDSLLSGLLANGCKSWRRSDGTIVPLNSRTIEELNTCEAKNGEDEFWCGDRALRNGLVLETEPTRGLVSKLARSMQFGRDLCLATKNRHQHTPYELPLAASQTADFVVIGGGIAGMQAALAAAERNHSVTLYECSSRLGGMCDYYGQAEDEEAPEALISRLSSQVLSHQKISVKLLSKVLDVRPGRALVLSSDVAGNSGAKQSLFWTNYKFLAIAVGADYGDRNLNRHSALSSAHRVFRMAADYGVKPVAPLSIMTGGNSGFRLGQLLLEAGIELGGIYDPRVEPTSRHIDFAKAVGVHMHFGQTPSALHASQRGIEVEFTSAAFLGGPSTKKQFKNLIVSHAPAPNLDFWVRSGGHCELDADGRIKPATKVNSNVALIGAASGSMTQIACISEAEERTIQLLGEKSQARRIYTGLYKYESDPQPLTFLTRAATEEGIRASANAPKFSAKPGRNALSEFLFERSAAGRSMSQIQAIGAFAIQDDNTAGSVALGFSETIKSRFETPCVAAISPQGYLNLSVGQLVYDADGVNQTPSLRGVVVEIDGDFAVVMDNSFYQTGQNVFVRTRGGFFAATVGELTDA